MIKQIKNKLQIIFIIFSMLLIGWMSISYIEIVHHNTDYILEGGHYTYSKANFFVLLIEIYNGEMSTNLY